MTITALSKTLCTITLVSGRGPCRLSARELALGTLYLVATYSGSKLYLASTKVAKLVVGGPTATSSVLRLSHLTGNYGAEQLVRISVTTTTRRAGSPAGTVAIREGSRVLCTIVLSNDAGSCRLSANQLGPRDGRLVPRQRPASAVSCHRQAHRRRPTSRGTMKPQAASPPAT